MAAVPLTATMNHLGQQPINVIMTWKIYHNPRCSKSRQTLQLLRDRGIEPQVIEYLKVPPNADDFRRLQAQTGLEARDLVRIADRAFADAGLDATTASDADLARAVAADPRLLQRPIVVVGDRAVVGRPPENVLKLLENT